MDYKAELVKKGERGDIQAALNFTFNDQKRPAGARLVAVMPGYDSRGSEVVSAVLVWEVPLPDAR